MVAYEGLRGQVSSDEPHLGGNVVEGDPFTFAPRVWDYLINRFTPRSVLDIGSGMGYAARYFHSKGLAVIASDGLKNNVEQALFPTFYTDLTRGPIFCRVDLVHCQEVVEHIEEEYVDNVIRSLACGKIIVITHAPPGHDGHHHVNLQPAEYWISKMATANCFLLEKDTERVRLYAKEDGAEFLENTGLVFSNRSLF